jgi:hypothetical protein
MEKLSKIRRVETYRLAQLLDEHHGLPLEPPLESG